MHAGDSRALATTSHDDVPRDVASDASSRAWEIMAATSRATGDGDASAGEEEDIERVVSSLRASTAEMAAVDFVRGGEYHYSSNFVEFEQPLKEMRGRITGCLRRLNALGGGVEAAGELEDAEEAFTALRDSVDERCDAIDAAVMIARGDEKVYVVQNTDASGVARAGRGFKRYDATCTRPQEQFDDGVDNSRSTVQHKGLTKPIGFSSYEAYAHALTSRREYAEFMVGPRPSVLPTPMDEEHPLEVVETPEALDALASHLDDCKEFAVDLEHHSYRSFKGFTCLMQISTRERDFVVDTLKLRSYMRDSLGKAFCDGDKLKIMHGADNDVQWLQKDFGMFINCLFDTGQAARVLELPSKGLSYLLHHYCGVKADKKFQLADWRLRPLTKDMLEYARSDTHYLLYVHDRLKEALHAQGATCVVDAFNRSRDVCLKRYELPKFDDGAYYEDLLKNDNLKELNDAQLSVYAALFSWRDLTARDADESVGYVMPRGLMLRIALSGPLSPRALLAECRGEAPLVAKHADAVSDVISRAHAVGVPSFKPTTIVAPDATSGAAAVVVPQREVHVHDTTLTNDGAAPVQTKLAPMASPAKKSKRKRGGTMASLMSGVGSTSKATAKTVVPLNAIFGTAWEDIEAPLASKNVTEVKQTHALENRSDGDNDTKPTKREQPMIELPGGVMVPAPLRPMQKDRPFIIPTDFGNSVQDDAAAARAELAERRQEVMRGYEDSDSDENSDDELREQVLEEAKRFDASAASELFSRQAREKYGMSGIELLCKPPEKKERKGFNQRFKAVYEEPFKAAPKPKMFPRQGNKFETFKN